MDSFLDHLTRMVNMALEKHLEPPFVALASEENPYLTHIPNKVMWPGLVVTEHHGVVKVGLYKDSQYIEQSAFSYSSDFVKVVSRSKLLEGLLELDHV